MDIVSANKNAIEFSGNFSLAIEEFCKPLKNYLGITFFSYFRLYKNGSYLCLSSDNNFMQDFIVNINYSHIFHQTYFNSNDMYDCALWPAEPKGQPMQVYLNHGYWHGVSLIPHQNKDYMEILCFLSTINNHNINNFYLKNFHVLEKFAQEFKRKFTNKIITTKDDKKLAIFSKGVDLNLPPKNIESDQEKIQSFLKAISVDDNDIMLGNKIFDISQKQLKCLELFSKGYLQKEIGQSLSMAPNTVQTHLHRIKEKTGIYRKADLIKVYNGLFKH